MKSLAFLIALAAPVAFAPAAAQAQPAPATDWTDRVEITAEGGYLMGNPEAPMRLVEYGSIACSHCADFETEQGRAIRDQVRSGRASFEYRPYLIFAADPAIFLLLRCQPPERFFRSIHALYRTQEEWVGRIEASEQQTGQAPTGAALLRASGLDQFFRDQGLSNAQINRCLGDRAAQAALAASNHAGLERGVRGTPTFFLNGRELQVESFADVTAALMQP